MSGPSATWPENSASTWKIPHRNLLQNIYLFLLFKFNKSSDTLSTFSSFDFSVAWFLISLDTNSKYVECRSSCDRSSSYKPHTIINKLCMKYNHDSRAFTFIPLQHVTLLFLNKIPGQIWSLFTFQKPISNINAIVFCLHCRLKKPNL